VPSSKAIGAVTESGEGIPPLVTRASRLSTGEIHATIWTDRNCTLPWFQGGIVRGGYRWSERTTFFNEW